LCLEPLREVSTFVNDISGKETSFDEIKKVIKDVIPLYHQQRFFRPVSQGLSVVLSFIRSFSSRIANLRSKTVENNESWLNSGDPNDKLVFPNNYQ
jgi:hypothetical protein